jgi:hypothetical protein
MNSDYIVTAILVGLGIIATLVAIREISNQREKEIAQHQEAAQFRDRAARAVWANATIVSIKRCKPKHDLGGKILIDLRLQVLTADQRSYAAASMWLVDSIVLPALQPGQHIPVKIDQENPRIIYPHMTGMEFMPRRDQCKGEPH